MTTTTTTTRMTWKDWIEIIGIIGAICVSIYSLNQNHNLQTELTNIERQVNFDPGELIIHSPSTFCIRRGLRAFPSDHIIIPIYVENTGKGAKSIEIMNLMFEDPATGELATFVMRGFIPALDTYSIAETYEVAFGLTIPERSLERYVLVFQAEEATRPNYENFIYRFDQPPSSGRIDMTLKYILDNSAEPTTWGNGDSEIFMSIPYANAFDDLELPQNISDFWDENTADLLANEATGTYNTVCFPTYNLSGVTPS